MGSSKHQSQEFCFSSCWRLHKSTLGSTGPEARVALDGRGVPRIFQFQKVPVTPISFSLLYKGLPLVLIYLQRCSKQCSLKCREGEWRM